MNEARNEMVARTSGSESGRPLTCYIHGATIDEILLRQSTTYDLPPTLYFHHDGLGSTVALTDSTGNVVESYTYDVYGQPSFLSATYQLLPTSSVTNRFLFTGREYLADLALYDYRHRFYSPSLGRFLQTDPLRFDADDISLYRYVTNNSVNAIDNWGLASPAVQKPIPYEPYRPHPDGPPFYGPVPTPQAQLGQSAANAAQLIPEIYKWGTIIKSLLTLPPAYDECLYVEVDDPQKPGMHFLPPGPSVKYVPRGPKLIPTLGSQNPVYQIAPVAPPRDIMKVFLPNDVSLISRNAPLFSTYQVYHTSGK